MIAFDHLKLIDGQPREMKRFRRAVLARQPGDTEAHAVLHEADGSCCRREGWNATLARIFAALRPSTPAVVLSVDRTAGRTVSQASLSRKPGP